ncbi:mineralocorticoid receptor-like isoform X1 [Xyrauchen texanus]|uniref:mineralocorticoid receptor-like isoform X1 n=2 Tax=Xyrauchen texanus TaxID=154827 RepID=UPI0022418984|nr:mineralocorticoid receptor-like isoform X1 [Xyrauchen texanus]XP_051982140.1 mineralocorticoid receptor-like isoform X1 [Xyrauchen texanus]
METKRYQSYNEGAHAENKWAQMPKDTMEYCCSTEECLKNSDVLMDIVNSSNAPNMPSVCKDNNFKITDTAMLRLNQNQPLAYPSFNNSFHHRKSETGSKELSKTVAESMGLYMNAAREADFGFGQQGTAGGQGSPIKVYPLCGRAVEDSQPRTTVSPKMKAPPAPFPSVSQLPNGGPQECAVGSAPVPSVLSTALSCGPDGSGPMSSPTGNNLVSSTTSPTYFDSDCPSLAPASTNLTQGHHTSSSTCSSVKSSMVGSPPLASPLSVIKSPVSSPHSIGSVRSPLSCNTNMISSVSSPTGNGGNSGNIGPSISSPPTAGTMAMSSPRNSSNGFSVSSPPSGLGLVQNDINSPEGRERGFKGFEFPKVENLDGEIFNIGLDAMGMAKYIKNEPGTDYRSMCLGSSKSTIPPSPFVTQIKTEPNREVTCSNPQFGELHHSLGCFPATETTYLSLRDNFDEYSLSGILGPPVSSLNGNYEPGVFPNNGLPKGIKQETNDGSYYQENNNVPTSAIVGVNSGGHSFHYQIGAQGTMSFSCHNLRDQTNPLLNLISPVAGLMETWKTCPGLSQGPLSARGEGYPGPGCLTENMESASLRHTSSTAKVCLVCGDEASGCHYGVVTCGSCKVFFKRAVEGQHNYLCAGRNDCIIDKIRRKNCPACRVRKCLQAGMNLGARKSKKLGKIKSVSNDSCLQNSKDGTPFLTSKKDLSPATALVPHVPAVAPFLSPSVCSVLELIEPEVVFSGYDNTQPDTTDHLLTSLNQLAGKQMIRVVKWAKVLPGFRSLPIEDQITLIQYSWMCLSSFSLSWRSYKHTNAQMLYFAPDLVFNEERMRQSAMYDLCVGMRQVSQEFVRLQLTYEEFLAMKVLLLLSTVPKDGLKNQGAFEEMRVNYIKELRRSVGKATNNSGQTWQRFFQLTKLLDAMHELVGSLLDFCFYTFRESQALKVEFPEMLVEIISDQIPKVESGLTHTLFFHKK